VTDAAGQTHVISTKKALIRSTESGEQLLVGVIRDITEQKQTESKLAEALAQLEQLSSTDPLTGLCNRRGFLLLGQQHLRTAARLGKHVSLLYMDLDNLKTVNDTAGHAEGDKLIVSTARLLESFFRSADIVSRIGGDEFVALTMTDRSEDSSSVRTRLIQSIAEHNAQHRPRIELSIGTAEAPATKETSLETLLTEADQAMYQVKRYRRASLSK
jgi:diguanylate cyclase (GGDEF)-like protein